MRQVGRHKPARFKSGWFEPVAFSQELEGRGFQSAAPSGLERVA